MKKSLFVLLTVMAIVSAFVTTPSFAEAEKTATVEYISYVKDYTTWHSWKTGAKDIDFLLLIVIQDGQKLVIKEDRPSDEFRIFLRDVTVGTKIYLSVGSSLMPGVVGSTGEYIKSMTNLTTGAKYNR